MAVVPLKKTAAIASNATERRKRAITSSDKETPL
jgi:hypothetical protein